MDNQHRAHNVRQFLKSAEEEENSGGDESGGSALQDIAKKIFSYQLNDPDNRMYNVAGGALGGAGLGTAASWLTGSPLTYGALGGGVAGGLAGRYGPPLLQKAIGRYVTNMVAPVAYEDKLKYQLEALKDDPAEYLRNAYRAVVHDEPSGYGRVADKEGDNMYSYRPDRSDPGSALEWAPAAREPLYRRMYGLNPRYSKGQFIRDPASNDPHKLIMNPRSEMAQRVVDNLHERVEGLKELRTDTAGKLGLEGERRESFISPRKDKFTSALFGGTTMERTPDGRRISDVWDFGLNPGEKVDSPAKVLRGLMNMLTTPDAVRVNIDRPHWRAARKALQEQS